jgi:hypothetical protein
MGKQPFVVDPKSVIGPGNEVIAARVMLVVGRAISRISGLKSWRFIIEDAKTGEHSAHFILILTSLDGGGNTCAFEKINTLKKHPEISNTGELRHTTDLPVGEVGYYGGISVDYYGIEPPASEDDSILMNANFNPQKTEPRTNVSGDYKMAFSGAHEAVDLGLVLGFSAEYNKICDEECRGMAYFYDFDKLREDQLVRYLMDSMNLPH